MSQAEMFEPSHAYDAYTQRLNKLAALSRLNRAAIRMACCAIRKQTTNSLRRCSFDKNQDIIQLRHSLKKFLIRRNHYRQEANQLRNKLKGLTNEQTSEN